MTITDIENLSAAELKERREELAAAIAGSPSEELASRYVQARMDAKLRDDKLSEQGTTITALTESVSLGQREIARLQEQSDTQGKQIGKLLAEIDSAAAAHVQASQQHEAQVAELQQKLASETARANRLKNQANRHQSAVSGAAKLLNDAIAAQQIENADAGN